MGIFNKFLGDATQEPHCETQYEIPSYFSLKMLLFLCYPFSNLWLCFTDIPVTPYTLSQKI